MALLAAAANVKRMHAKHCVANHDAGANAFAKAAAAVRVTMSE